MLELPATVLNADQLRAWERHACRRDGIELYALMERAGAAIWQVVKRRFPGARSIAVATGPGNNGGDGWVIARLALQSGWAVCVRCAVDPQTLHGDARRAYENFISAGGQLAHAQCVGDVHVDALLGIGARGPMRGAVAELAQRCDPARTLSIDIPSGLNADTGAAEPGAVNAKLTVTLIAPKLGLLTGQGPAHTGELELADLGIAPAPGGERAANRVTASAFATALAPRPRTAHKGQFGHVLAIGGALGMGGAIRLTGEAALRSGAGRVTVVCARAHRAALVAACPELMWRSARNIAESAAHHTVVIGPGLGQGAFAQSLWPRVCALKLPMVIDADALNLIARDRTPPPLGSILTPHPLEAARLLNRPVADIEANRPLAARALAQQYGAVVVLKGAGTLIAAPDGTLAVNTLGNPGMATAGAGDVLAGVIAALCAQGLAPFDAARFGVYAHALAGDLAAKAGERGLIARDLMGTLRAALNPRRLDIDAP
jgi:ADP-dependent NAD(P)H-hydrate dehydratase / NAD(P)H-hydrate epimerase